MNQPLKFPGLFTNDSETNPVPFSKTKTTSSAVISPAEYLWGLSGLLWLRDLSGDLCLVTRVPRLIDDTLCKARCKAEGSPSSPASCHWPEVCQSYEWYFMVQVLSGPKDPKSILQPQSDFPCKAQTSKNPAKRAPVAKVASDPHFIVPTLPSNVSQANPLLPSAQQTTILVHSLLWRALTFGVYFCIIPHHKHLHICFAQAWAWT